MTSIVEWLCGLFVTEGQSADEGGALIAAIWVGAAEEAVPDEVDLALEAFDADEAQEMLRTLLRIGTVGTVRIAVGPALSASEARRLRRFARRLRPLGMAVQLV